MPSDLFKIIITVLVLIPNTIYAAEISVESRTYYAYNHGDKFYEKGDIGSLYEYLSFDAEGESISFVFSGWGRVETMDEQFSYDDSDTEDGNVSAAYLDYSSDISNFNIKLGKQPLIIRGGYEGMTGLSVRSDLPLNLKVSAFVGIPEELEERSSEDDIVEGGRVTAGIPGMAEIGAGYFREEDASEKFREEISYDLWLMPVNMLELFAETIENNITDSQAYTSYEAVIYISSKLAIFAKHELISYEDYYEGAEVNIFNLYSVGEELKTTSAALSLDILESLSLKLEIADHKFDESDDARSFGGGIKASLDNSAYGLSYHNTDSEDADEGYIDEFRFYTLQEIKEELSLSLDVVYNIFEKKINNIREAYMIIASAGYAFKDNLRVSVDVEYNDNPDYEEDLRAFARLEYDLNEPISSLTGQDED